MESRGKLRSVVKPLSQQGQQMKDVMETRGRLRSAVVKPQPPPQSQEMKDVISVIRALINSRKQMSNIKDVCREYKEMQGEPIPYKKLGFNTMEKMLEDSGDFFVKNNNGETIVSIKVSKNDQHISDLVRSTKSKNPTKSRPAVNTKPTSTYKPYKYQTYSHNSTAASNTNWRARENNSNAEEQRPKFNNAKKVVTTEPAVISKEDLRSKLSGKKQSLPASDPPVVKSAALLMRQSSEPGAPSKTNTALPAKSPTAATINNNKLDLNNNNPVKKEFTKTASAIQFGQPENRQLSGNSINFSSNSNRPFTSNPLPIRIEHPSSRSVNHRLNIQRPKDEPEVADDLSSKSSNRTPTPPVYEDDQEELALDLVEDPVLALINKCNNLDISEPTFNRVPGTKLIHYCVVVNDQQFSSYPENCRTEEEAKKIAAKNALAYLLAEEKRKTGAVCEEDDCTLANMIYDLLKYYPNGLVDKALPKEFWRAHHINLPDHWTGLMLSYSKWFKFENGQDCFIVMNKEEQEISLSEDAGEDSNVGSLGLPWEQKHWNLYISNPANTTTVWARIIGDEYSAKMDAMMTDIEMHMISDKVKATVVELNKIYLITASSCWFRVRCNQIDFENNRALCFFIDMGEEEWYPMDQLFLCDKKFLKLSGQVVMFSLYGLEGFEDNPYAKSHLDKMLNGKTVVAEVISKPEEYEQTQKVKTLLFDTSGDEDINLVTNLLNNICEDTPPPQLERTGVTHVNITYISDVGEVYCQLKNSGYNYIKKLTQSIVDNKTNMDTYRGLIQNAKGGERYLIFDRMSHIKQWYRATLEEKIPQKGIGDTQNKMYCIDYGFSKAVKNSDIYYLEPLSLALSKFPPLAIKCRLHDVNNINEQVVARIKNLLPQETAAIIKVMAISTIPFVNIYKRLESNIMVCVNETIRVEQELEKCNSDMAGGDNNVSSNVSINPTQAIKAVAATTAKTKYLNPIKEFNLPTPNSFFNVYVTLASNPFNFIVQPHDQRSGFHEMMRKLQAYCATNNEFMTEECIETGQFYAAQHSDGKWLRASVERKVDSSIHVYFCDYGEIAVLSTHKLKLLPAEYRQIPKQAIKCKLFGIEPIHKDWTTHDCVKFNQLTVNKNFVSVIKSVTQDEFFNEKIIEVILIDTSSEADIKINEVLKNEGRAIAAN